MENVITEIEPDVFGAHIVIRAGYASIHSDADLVHRLFMHAEFKFWVGNAGQIRTGVSEKIRLFMDFYRGKQAYIVHLGLAPVIERALRDAGVNVAVHQIARCPESLYADQAVMSRLAGPWNNLACRLTSSMLGVIQVPNTAMVVQSLVTLCKIFPTQNILFFCDRRNQARFIKFHLERFLGTEIELGVKQQPARCRVVASTFVPPMVPEAFQIVVVPFAADLESDKAHEVLNYSFKGMQRRYAFAQSSSRPSIRARQTTEAYFGQVIHGFSPKPAMVRVLICNCFDYPAKRMTDALAFKRTGVWNNDRRNQIIAATATAVCNKDLTGLWDLGLLLKSDRFPSFLGSRSWRVALLVENSEHAAVLSALLPDWAVLSVRSGCACAWPAREDAGEVGGFIVTTSWAKLRHLKCDVVIRADGGLAAHLFGFPSTATDCGLIVDFNDPGTDQRNLKRRLASYEKAGWKCL